MTRHEALTKLLPLVRRGEWSWVLADAAGLGGHTAFGAFSGSMDHAKALHTSLIDGADWAFPNSRRIVLSHSDFYDVSASGDDPARTWLVAIIMALIAKEEC